MSSQSQNTSSYSGYVTTSATNAGNSSRLGVVPTRDASDLTRQIREQIMYNQNKANSVIQPGDSEHKWMMYNNEFRLSYLFGKMKCSPTVSSTTVSISTFGASVAGVQLVTTTALGSLKAGAIVAITGAANAVNNGTFTVLFVDTGANTFVCTNAIGVTASTQTATGTYQTSTSLCTGGTFAQNGAYNTVTNSTAYGGS
jgi:hypothetical protein